MKIGVIQASSQSEKNDVLHQCVCRAAAAGGQDDTVINFGTFKDTKETFSYIEAALNISLLLSSGATDFIVTGCSSGQGMMLACNSLPGVLCGFVQNPQDAFLFGRINGGNAVSFPLGLNYGWLGEINLQCTMDKLFEGEFGSGYPPQDAERKKRDMKQLKEISRIAKRPAEEVFPCIPGDLMRHALQWPGIREYILDQGTDWKIRELIASL